MSDQMTDERALELVRWLTNGSDASPPPPDVTLQQAYDHIAARLKAAQEPVTQATGQETAVSSERCDADVYRHGVSLGLFQMTKQEAEDYCVAETKRTGRRHDWHFVGGRAHVKALDGRTPPPPALPEVTEADVAAALDASGAVLPCVDWGANCMREGLKSYRARLAKAVPNG